jgi:hypothetical protein
MGIYTVSPWEDDKLISYDCSENVRKNNEENVSYYVFSTKGVIVIFILRYIAKLINVVYLC